MASAQHYTSILWINSLNFVNINKSLNIIEQKQKQKKTQMYWLHLETIFQKSPASVYKAFVAVLTNKDITSCTFILQD